MSTYKSPSSTPVLEILTFKSAFVSPNVQITLLLKLVPDIGKAISKIKTTLKHIDSQFSTFVQLRYTVVGFGGEDVYKEAHIQTSNGDIVYDVNSAFAALDRLQFNGKKKNEKFGISALKFAAAIQKERGTRIFFLFENDATYTNLLRQMMDVYGALQNNGIVLNVVNNYKMRPNVIAKDSHRTRYHVRMPEGEEFSRGISFPPTDDYIPYVKQTGGAVFTLKAFTTKDDAWSKALPSSVTRILQKQIDKDVNQCKNCNCLDCKNVDRRECDYELYCGPGSGGVCACKPGFVLAADRRTCRLRR